MDESESVPSCYKLRLEFLGGFKITIRAERLHISPIQSAEGEAEREYSLGIKLVKSGFRVRGLPFVHPQPDPLHLTQHPTAPIDLTIPPSNGCVSSSSLQLGSLVLS